MHKVTILILLVLLLTSCNNSTDSSYHSLNNIKSASSEFRISNENKGLTYRDFDNIYSLCKLFLEEFYNATISNETMNLDTYLNNDNFKHYIFKKIEIGSKVSISKVKNLVFGIENIEWYLSEGYVLVNMDVNIEQEVGGFGESHQFLISNKDGRLLILDWYSKSAGSVSYLDEIVRGNINKINNPDIWNDKEWVDNIFGIIDKKYKGSDVNIKSN